MHDNQVQAQAVFSGRLLPRRRSWEEQIPTSIPLPTIPKLKKFWWVKKTLLEDSPQGSWTINNILGPQKGDIVSVMTNNCIDASHVTNLIKDCAHSTQSTPTATALQWAQQNLVVLNTSPGNNGPIAAGHLHLAAQIG